MSDENYTTNVDAAREDRAAAQSEDSGRVGKREAQELVGELRADERDVAGRTRGKDVDAYQQERAVDGQVDEALDRPDARNPGY